MVITECLPKQICLYTIKIALSISIFWGGNQLNVASFADTIPTTPATQTDQTGVSVSQTTSNAAASNPAISTQTAMPFKLSASKVNLGLEQLNDVGLDLKNVLSATRHLYDEVMIQPVEILTEPEMVAGCVISLPIGTIPTGPPKPARKARVDLIMAQIRPVLDLLKQNANEFMADSQISHFPADLQTKLDPLFKKWLTHMDDVYGRLLDLERMTVGPTYDNYAIANTTQIIQEDVKQIDEARRPIYKLLQEEAKRITKADQ